MAHTAKGNEAVERFAKTTRDSYRAVLDHAVGLQERNVRFAQSLVDGSMRELRRQTESNLAMTQELADRVGEQGDALRMFVEESAEAYMNLLYAPFSFYEEGLQAAKHATAR